MEKTFTLANRREVADGTTELTLAPKEPSKLFSFIPGQYVEIWQTDAPYSDERGAHREFSINSATNEPNLRITFRNSESAAKRGFLEAPMGAEFQVTGPHGYFTLSDLQLEPVVLIAGGVGITPFLSMVRTNASSNEPRQITLIAANAKPERAPHREEMGHIAAKNDWFSYNPVYSQLTAEIIQKAVTGLENPHFYLAGPAGMVAAIFEMLGKLGVPRQAIQLEEFYGYQ
jgi:ferredoxin-NADP reductase